MIQVGQVGITQQEINIYGRKLPALNYLNLRTFKGNKVYMKNLRNYILNIIKEDAEDSYGIKNTGEKEIMSHFVSRFESEFNHPYNKRDYPILRIRIENYLLGLAYNFAYTYHSQTEQAIEFHNIKFGDIDESLEFEGGHREISGKEHNSYNENNIRKHLFEMVSQSIGKGNLFSNYYFQMITQEIIKLLKKHKLNITN